MSRIGSWFTALFFEILNARQKRPATSALLVAGMSSIAAYCLETLVSDLVRHFTQAPFRLVGSAFEARLLGAASLALIWLVLWSRRQRMDFRRL